MNVISQIMDEIRSGKVCSFDIKNAHDKNNWGTFQLNGLQFVKLHVNPLISLPEPRIFICTNCM